MIQQEILKNISANYAPLSPECQQELLEEISMKSFQKGTVLVREGQFATKAYFILQGCARAYFLKDGKDVSDWFAFENEFISPIMSFFGEAPSPHYIEVVQDALIIELSKERVEYLAGKYHDFEHLIRVIVTKTMLSQCERLSAMLFQTAKERYEHLLSIRPDIVNRVPLMHIASYIGITLETLSRIRRPKRRI